MKSIILFLIIGLSFSYNANDAISYARKYCKSYNTYYASYPGLDTANFVSQCLIAGGQTFDNCLGLDDKGSISNIANLISCLIKKGWKYQEGFTKKFLPGYPFFLRNNDAMLATDVSGKNITFCGHSTDRCNRTTSGDQYTYFYLDN